ncbi:hypothetical protein BG844_37945 [Couchioplanes caeruleus subsp. caeruleus]|uniref:Fibronectin type-III domain-containing protein n=2 Tax=Couchioplanes caeruleus TaxID=56438 RepID=A0A1K0GB41_9ACTN|nr:hypothetical protein BG844_37945 [Couchioplanes caeruleus subsp. caeruleus]
MVAVLSLSLLGSLAAPISASAAVTPPAPEAPPTPVNVNKNRAYMSPMETQLFWAPAPRATSYDVTVTDGTTTNTYSVPSSAYYIAMGTSIKRFTLRVPTPDKCTSYKITLAARNAGGVSAPVLMTEKTLAPTIVTKAFATRGSAPTIGKFTMSAPHWRGYLGDPVRGTAWADDPMNATGTLNVKMDLVRLVDNKVVNTASWAVGRWSTGTRTQNFFGLEAKRAYVLQVTISNGWGSCSRQVGKILLPRLP